MSSIVSTTQTRDIVAFYKWIDSYNISRQKRNVHRDFSDAVPLAEMLKVHFPKEVELHNYSPSNAFAQKVDNWRTLQRKVLSKKLNLTFPQNVLEAVSRCETGVAEDILWQIKLALDKIEMTKKNKDLDVYRMEGFDEEMTDDVIAIKVKQGTKILDRKIVPANAYEEMVENIKIKDEAIKKLQEKIYHLEQMVELKDARIEDLRTKLNEENSVQSTKRFLNNLF